MRTLAKNLLVLSALALVVIYFANIFPRMQKGLDFPDFYAAARMVRDGRDRELYDPLAQDQYLIRYSGRVELILFILFYSSSFRNACLFAVCHVAVAVGLYAVVSLSGNTADCNCEADGYSHAPFAWIRMRHTCSVTSSTCAAYSSTGEYGFHVSHSSIKTIHADVSLSCECDTDAYQQERYRNRDLWER